jgi:hypothetical protein
MSEPAREADQRMLTQLRKTATRVGAQVELKGAGHFHIQGALLVNYYPFSKKRTAYVANTTKSVAHLEPRDAVKLAMTLPPVTKDFKRKSYRPMKLKMLKKHAFCHWCKCALVDETATVDHRIPLSRGGLDNDNNRVLACVPCNNKRGNTMPELKVTP